MRVKVQYVENVHKDVRRMVAWWLHKPGQATMVEVASFYKVFGTGGAKQSLAQWVGVQGRPEYELEETPIDG